MKTVVSAHTALDFWMWGLDKGRIYLVDFVGDSGLNICLLGVQKFCSKMLENLTRTTNLLKRFIAILIFTININISLQMIELLNDFILIKSSGINNDNITFYRILLCLSVCLYFICFGDGVYIIVSYNFGPYPTLD